MTKKTFVRGALLVIVVALGITLTRLVLRDRQGACVFDIAIPGATFLAPGVSAPHVDEIRVILHEEDPSLARGDRGESRATFEAWLAELWPGWQAKEFLATTSTEVNGTRLWTVEVEIVDPRESNGEPEIAWLLGARRPGGPQIGTILRWSGPEIDWTTTENSRLGWAERLQLGVPIEYSITCTTLPTEPSSTER